MSRNGKQRVFAAVAIALGIALALGISEVVLRFFPPPSRWGTKLLLLRGDGKRLAYHCYPSNPHGELQPAPEVGSGSESGEWRLLSSSIPPRALPLDLLAETPWCVEYVRSEQGLRDRFYPVQPAPEDPQRIAMVGDSFVIGEGVALEATLPRQLEAALSGGGGGGRGVQVINAGSSGASLSDSVRAFAEVTRGLHADRAVLVYIPNDVELSLELRARESMIHDLINQRYGRHFDDDPAPLTFRTVELIRDVWALRDAREQTLSWYRAAYDPASNAAGLEALERDFRTIAAAAGVRTLVVLYPLLVDLGDYPLAAAHETPARAAEKAGLEVLDLRSVYAGEDAAALQVHAIDHHPNRRAHRLAAQAIAARLRSLPGFLR